ncbi:hypothetical protein BC332_18223 [Capsicum chinense]|nr:hypothetical protein BC332_18223 [Capsicum chinense]
MAGLSPITADIGCKPIQEMVKDGDEMPDEYVCKDFHYGTIDDDVAIIDILVVDLKVLTSSSACGREELGKLRSALSSWGYFQYGDRPVMDARFSFYPPYPRPKPVHGIKPHADGSAITILLQDKEIMSNELLKSPVHRVVTNSEKERITVAMFCSPESGSEIVMTRTGALVVTNIPNHKGLKHPYMSDNHAHNS